MPQSLRIAFVLLFAVASGAMLFFLPPVPQDPAFHNFADQRTLFLIPHALNVLSNLPFLLVGLAGIVFLLRQRPWPAGVHFLEPRERWPYLIFFLGVTFTAFGSSYYHLAPDNARLVWDRLPMTLGFMSFLVAMMAERVSLRVGLALLLPMLLLGVASVFYWHWTELHAAGDLRPYIAVQFFPILAIPLMLLLFPARYTRTADIWISVALYLLAKLLEFFDRPLFEILHGSVSGHSLKHLAAAASAWWILRMLRRRVPA